MDNNKIMIEYEHPIIDKFININESNMNETDIIIDEYFCNKIKCDIIHTPVEEIVQEEDDIVPHYVEKIVQEEDDIVPPPVVIIVQEEDDIVQSPVAEIVQDEGDIVQFPVAEIAKEEGDIVPHDDTINEFEENDIVQSPVAEIVQEGNDTVQHRDNYVQKEESQPKYIIEQLFYKLPPKYVFIIPYRDREPEKEYFIKHMSFIFEKYDSLSYRFLFIHQKDKRLFNRGAMKNIGFISIKMQYPNEYQNITLIFNDVDTMPKTKNLINYDTTIGKVKHYYGFRFSLGGIFSIKSIDFEKCNGFPNFFGYAYEDNLLYKRCQDNGIEIDRSNFFIIGDSNIIQTNRSGPYRIIKKSEFNRFINNTNEGIYQIYNLKYTIEQINNNAGFIHVHSFETPYPDNPNENKIYDIRTTSQPFKPNPNQIRKNVQKHLKMKFI
jgi:hypothetical protein